MKKCNNTCVISRLFRKIEKNWFYLLIVVLLILIILPFAPTFKHLVNMNEFPYYEMIGAIGVLIAAIQYVSDCYRKRKEESITVLRNWSEHLQAATSSARKLVDLFSKEQCKSLQNEDELYLYGEEQNKFFRAYCSACSSEYHTENVENRDGEQIMRLTRGEVVRLRYLIIQYLNSLETLLLSWQMNVVDKDIVEVEMGYLISNSYGTLFNFREIQGGKMSYPAIAEFEEEMREKFERPY